jgi:hypothetical protein
MKHELNELLERRADRGEHRGADRVLIGAGRDLDPTHGRVVPDRRRRAVWIPALGAAVVAIIAIGGVALLASPDAPPSTTNPPVAATTTEPATTAPSTTMTTSAPSTTLGATAPAPRMRWDRFTDTGFEDDALVETIVSTGTELVAVGGIYESDGVSFPQNHTAAWVSADGVTWERVGSEQFGGLNTDAGRMMAAAHGPNGLVGISTSNDRDGVIWLSADGHSWERVDDPALGGQGAQLMEFVATGPGGLVAAGYGEREVIVAVSADGTAWTRIDDGVLQVAPEWLHGFVAGDFGYILIGQEHVSEAGRAPAMWVSPDGTRWDRIPVNTFTNGDPIYVTSSLDSIGITSDGALVVWDEWGNAWISTDGYDWDLLAPDDVPVTGVIRDGERAVAIGDDGIVASGDGEATWGPVLTGSIDDLVRFGDYFVAFGEAPTSTGADTEFTHTVWIGTWEN